MWTTSTLLAVAKSHMPVACISLLQNLWNPCLQIPS
jgi:hypothetical protein